MTVERNAKGQFVSGGNPNGRPKRRKGYLDVLEATCTPTKWKAICDKAVEQATAGDKVARRWVTENLIGKPLARIKAEIDTRSRLNVAYANDLNLVYGDGEDSPQTGLPSEPS